MDSLWDHAKIVDTQGFTEVECVACKRYLCMVEGRTQTTDARLILPCPHCQTTNHIVIR